MGAAVAALIRVIIQAGVTTAIFTGIEKLLGPLIDGAKSAVKNTFGISDGEASDAIANEIIDAFAMIGILGVAIKTKLPTIVADRLGFTSKGYSKRTVSAKVKAAQGSAAKLATTASKVTAAEVGTISEVVASTRKLNGALVKSLLDYTFKYVGLTTATFFAFAQYIDFANWQGPYQKTFQGLLSIIGLEPDTALPKANTISDDIWKRIYSVIEELKPTAIIFPFSGQTRTYTRENLAELINEVAANLQKDGTNPTYKNVIAIVLPLIQLTGQTRTDAQIDAIIAKYSSGKTSTTTTPTSTSITKVFTGIVSQGKVGSELVFTPRPDDLIESVEELKQAAANNLAPFLVTLPGRVVYEIKVVSTVTTKSGFTQRGTAQKIQTGTTAAGVPRYKTVVNKFAVLNVYAITDKGSRAKLTTIVLGPTDAAKLTIGQNDLTSLENALSSLVTTSNPNDVENITPPTNSATDEPKEVTFTRAKTVLDYGYVLRHDTKFPEGVNWISIPGNNTAGITGGFQDVEINLFNKLKAAGVPVINGQGLTIQELAALGFNASTSRYGVLDEKEFMEQLRNRDISDGAGIVVTVPVAEVKAEKSGSKATTLYEWYTMQGKSLPSVEERSKDYLRLGLGQEKYYTGTAEQNAKLLAALKAQ